MHKHSDLRDKMKWKRSELLQSVSIITYGSF